MVPAGCTLRNRGSGHRLTIVMITIIALSPIIASVAVLVYALRHGFNKTALYASAGLAMVITMFAMKYSGTWYSFLMGLTVPFAVAYVLICLYLSVKEDRDGR